MGYLGENIPKLGFGLMRLPMRENAVDIAQVKAMVDMFIEKGFTYFDTAYGYINGLSEEAAKKALVDRYPREKFQLATKLPAWAGVQTKKQAEEMFWTSLKRTGAGYFDFYLLHNLGGERTAAFDRFDIWNFLAERKKEGLIRHLGFSFHDHAHVLDGLLTAHPDMEFVQLQINYADWDDKAVQSRLCYEVAQKHNKPVIIMEPVKGGSLAMPPESVRKILTDAAPEKSLASWALRFSASLPGLVTVLSGMSNLEQIRENIETFENFSPLTLSERETIARAQEALSKVPQIPCTRCMYCVKGCPEHIAIPGIFRAVNNYLIYKNEAGARGNYAWETRDGGVASKCVACGQCESACPQHIKIIDELRYAAQVFEG